MSLNGKGIHQSFLSLAKVGFADHTLLFSLRLLLTAGLLFFAISSLPAQEKTVTISFSERESSAISSLLKGFAAVANMTELDDLPPESTLIIIFGKNDVLLPLDIMPKLQAGWVEDYLLPAAGHC